MAKNPKVVTKYRTKTVEKVKRVMKRVQPDLKDAGISGAGGVLPAVGERFMGRIPARLRPVVVMAAGAGLVVLGKQKKNEKVQFAGMGMAGAGAYMLTKMVMGGAAAPAAAGAISYQPTMAGPIDFANNDFF